MSTENVQLDSGLNINQSVLKAHTFPCFKVSISQQCCGTCSPVHTNSSVTTMLNQEGPDHQRIKKKTKPKHREYGVRGVLEQGVCFLHRSALSVLIFGVSGMWNSFPPYFSSTHTISLYAKAAWAHRLPKSAANFELKGKQKQKRKKKEQESAGPFILHLLKDTPNVPTPLETRSYLQT